MITGWLDRDYLTLFDDQIEAIQKTQEYGITDVIANFTLIGLISWDDFILKDKNGAIFSVPTVPLDQQFLKPINLVIDQTKIKADSSIQDKIKWYIQPIVFGGSPTSNENIAWIDIEQHIQAVRFWNQKYKMIKGNEG